MRLCSLAATFWPLIDASYYQINLLRQPPARFLGLVYAWAIERVESDKRDEWEMELVDLLPWQSSASEAAIQMESESFFAMQGKGG